MRTDKQTEIDRQMARLAKRTKVSNKPKVLPIDFSFSSEDACEKTKILLDIPLDTWTDGGFGGLNLKRVFSSKDTVVLLMEVKETQVFQWHMHEEWSEQLSVIRGFFRDRKTQKMCYEQCPPVTYAAGEPHSVELFKGSLISILWKKSSCLM